MAEDHVVVLARFQFVRQQGGAVGCEILVGGHELVHRGRRDEAARRGVSVQCHTDRPFRGGHRRGQRGDAGAELLPQRGQIQRRHSGRPAEQSADAGPHMGGTYRPEVVNQPFEFGGAVRVRRAVRQAAEGAVAHLLHDPRPPQVQLVRHGGDHRRVDADQTAHIALHRQPEPQIRPLQVVAGLGRHRKRRPRRARAGLGREWFTEPGAEVHLAGAHIGPAIGGGRRGGQRIVLEVEDGIGPVQHIREVLDQRGPRREVERHEGRAHEARGDRNLLVRSGAAAAGEVDLGVVRRQQVPLPGGRPLDQGGVGGVVPYGDGPAEVIHRTDAAEAVLPAELGGGVEVQQVGEDTLLRAARVGVVTGQPLACGEHTLAVAAGVARGVPDGGGGGGGGRGVHATSTSRTASAAWSASGCCGSIVTGRSRVSSRSIFRRLFW